MFSVKLLMSLSCCAEQWDRYGGVRWAGRLRGSGPGAHSSPKKHPRGLVRWPAVHWERHPLQSVQVKPWLLLLPSDWASGLEMGCGAGVDDTPPSGSSIHLNYTVREKPARFAHQLVYTATWLRERQLCGGELGFRSAVYKLRDDFYSTVCWGWRNCKTSLI